MSLSMRAFLDQLDEVDLPELPYPYRHTDRALNKLFLYGLVRSITGFKTLHTHLLERPAGWSFTHTATLLAILRVMGKKARIKRLRLEHEQVDAIGEAYIHALEQLMAGELHVTLFGHPVVMGDDASLALQHELAHRSINPEEVLRAVKRKHRADVET